MIWLVIKLLIKLQTSQKVGNSMIQKEMSMIKKYLKEYIYIYIYIYIYPEEAQKYIFDLR